MFIAPQCGAIISSSVNYKTIGIPNFYFKCKKTVSAMIKKYYNFLDISQTFLEKNPINLKSYIKTESNIILSQQGLSLSSVPECLSENMNSEYKNCYKSATRLLDKNTVMDYGSLYTPEEIRQGVLIPLSGISSFNRIYYTEESYKLHLKNILFLMEKYENYQFSISETSPLPQSYFIGKDSYFLCFDNKITPDIYYINKYELVRAVSDIFTLQKSSSKKDTINKIQLFLQSF